MVCCKHIKSQGSLGSRHTYMFVQLRHQKCFLVVVFLMSYILRWTKDTALVKCCLHWILCTRTLPEENIGKIYFQIRGRKKGTNTTGYSIAAVKVLWCYRHTSVRWLKRAEVWYPALLWTPWGDKGVFIHVCGCSSAHMFSNRLTGAGWICHLK